MSFGVNVHRLFWLDVAKATVYYESVSIQVALHFEESFDKAYDNLIQKLEAYFNISKDTRRIPVANFPYQIIYSFQNKTISIWSLHHTSSNKKNWRQRIKRL